MAQAVHVHLFGDQTFDYNPKLRALLTQKGNPILTAFFEQAYYVIRSEVGKLSLQQRGTFPRFRSLADLLTRQREGPVNPAFQTAMACVYQLGFFLSQYGENGRAYPSSSDTYLLGLCTGALAASAISCCKSLSELLPAAVQAVAVAFRLGLCVVDVRNRIESQSEESWSMVVLGLAAGPCTEVLREFSKANHLPPTSRPWISAHINNGSTVSAPPSVLEALRGGPLSKYKTINIPIRVPAHTSHLFSFEDVKTILESTSDSQWAPFTSKIPIVSSATGKLICGGNFRGLLQTVLTEILLEPLRWDKINDELPLIVRSNGAAKIKIIPLATTAENTLLAAFQNFAQEFGESKKYWPHSSYWPSQEDLNQTPVEIEYLDSNASHFFSGRPGLSKIAIVGMSGRFPDAESPEAFWDLLHKGLDVAKEVPPKRWDTKTHVDPTGKTKNTGAVPWGCWLNNPGLFDARFFSISPKEAPQIDPAQRLALMTTYEAMEQAGIVPGTTPSTMTDRIGVFHGVTSNDYMETNTAQDIDTHFIVGGNRAFIPGRINFCFEFCGPSYSVDTACSSSLAAIHLACNALWRGDCDTAVAGGTNMVNNPDGHTGLDRGFFLSKTGNCKPFDDNADGYCRGEGVGTVFLKRLEDALADGDPIQGVIVGARTNHSAESDSITRPHVGAQKAIFDQVLNETGVDPYELSYIEMHGTGTQVGDAVEMTSVLDIFAPESSSRGRRTKDQAVYLGAAKANIGHGEGVSGVTSLAKVLLMMKKDTIPPHCGIKPGSKINHNYPTDLDERNVHIAFEPTPWQRPEGKARKVLINNFSAAGGNTALLIEDGPLVASGDGEIDTRSSHLIAVSAKCGASLKGNLHALLNYINAAEEPVSLPRLSYTTTARRLHHPHRVIVSGSDIQEVKTKLGDALARGDGVNRAKGSPKIVFTFTGQGSQYLGMGKQLFESFSQFRDDIRRFDQLARSQGFPSFQRIFVTTDGDVTDFTPLVVQLAMTCIQMAMARLWTSWGVAPAAVVGHSLGEYAALNIAGVLSDSDTIYLVGRRAELLQERCEKGTHAMLAVHASVSKIRSLLVGKSFEIACINGPDDTVLGGSVDQISDFEATLAAHQLKVTLLKVPYAFHTSQVDQILDTFEAAAHGVTFHKPAIPVICPLKGSVVTEAGTFGAKYLAQHCRETVDILAALRSAEITKIISNKSFFIEIGPHPVVSGMVKATIGAQTPTFATLVRNKETWPLLTAALSALYVASLDIKWQTYQRDFKASHKVLDLPAYSWDLKEYWVKYENDWCIAKGDPKMLDVTQALPSPKIEAPEPKARSAPVPEVETTTVHKVVEEIITGHDKGTVIVESDFSREDLNSIAKGHKVNQIPLTTPSVYADMALTVGTYLLDRYKPDMRDRLVDVSDLVVEKALVPHSQGPQLLRTKAEVDWSKKSARCIFYSCDDKGKGTIGHAECTIRFTDRSQLPTLQKKVPEYLARIDSLRKGIESGSSMRLNQTAGYKLISTLAQFHPDYRAIDEVVLDSAACEAYSLVSFGQVKAGGKFSTHPAYIDVLTQTAGFVMNAKDDTDLDVEVYVNHGWESFQIYEEIDSKKKYQTYVKMAKAEGTIWVGDTVMLDGDRVVAFFKGVALRGVPRKLFHSILAASDTTKGKKGVNKAPNNIAPKATPQPTMPAATPRLSTPVQQASLPPKPTPQVKVQALPQSKSTQKDQITPALLIISEESGIAVDDLTDDCAFTDIGVDSLLSMVIASRFREELGLDLDLEFSIFLDLPTVKHLKDFLQPAETSTGQVVAKTYAEPAVEVLIVSKVENSMPEKAKEIAPLTYTGPVDAGASAELLASALQVISEESGIAVDDLTDDCAFTEIGVDSLLSMVIASRFREELGLDLDLEFSIFLDLPTVKDLKVFLSGNKPESIQPTVPSEQPIVPTVESSPEVAIQITYTDTAQDSATADALVTSALQVISEESGIAVDDLTDDCSFTDIGVDSLLSMVIASRFREELGLDLDLEFSIFTDLPTVKDLKSFLAGSVAPTDTAPEAQSSQSSSTSGVWTPETKTLDQDVISLSDDSPVITPASQPEPRSSYCKPATSVVLQGIPSTSTRTLFLLPDGGGSSSSYVPLPRLTLPNTTLIGLNCPYARDPQNMQCTSSALMASYMAEIQRRQPHGPYHIGGWSSGGIMSFMLASLLTSIGEEVHTLIIIDSPIPKIMDRLPTRFYEFCDSIGLFGYAMGATNPGAPDYLIPHFNATVEVLHDYRARPMSLIKDGAKKRRVGIVWAEESVMDEKNVPPEELRDSKGIHFLMERRADFGTCGWEELVPDAEFMLERSSGNHFSMMQKPLINKIGKFIEKVMSED